MNPQIDTTALGSITIGGKEYHHDVVIRLDGTIHKRKKQLSKKVTGTAHVIALDEIQRVFEKEATDLVIGTGQENQVRLSTEALEFLDGHGVRVIAADTPRALRLWNGAFGKVVGLFHVNC
jgi:hypothetical protein